MKANFKFNAAQMDVIRKSVESFKNDSLKKIAEDMVGGVAAPHSKAHVTGGWERSKPAQQLESSAQ